MITNFKYYLLFISILLLGQSAVAQIEPPTIISVTIDPQPSNIGTVTITWLPSNSEKTIGVSGYYIFRYFVDENHNSAAHLIDSVLLPPSKLSYSYTDSNAQAHLKSESYDIVTFKDSANLQSDPTPIHSTMYLHKIVYDSCDMTNTLTWNNYDGWGGDALYDILNADDGSVISSGISDTVFIHNIQPLTFYNYQIKAVQQSDTIIKSISNTVSITTTSVKEPDASLFFIKNIMNNGASVNFTTSIDNTADLKGHSLMVSDENTIFSEVEFKQLDKNSSIVEFNYAIDGYPKFYKVEAVNTCNKKVLESEVVKSLDLTINSNETEANLSWSKSFIESTESYSIYVSIDGGNQDEIENSFYENSYTYEFNSSGSETSEIFCFRIMATNTELNTSLSNEQCATRIPKVEFPNAFTPNGDGLNDTFGPFSNYIKNAVVVEFKLIIYDKYGGSVFETDNSNDLWSGRANGGKPVTEGGYIYYLWFKTSQQKVYEQSGSINVVFP